MSRQTSLALLLTVSLLLNWRPRPVAAQSSEPVSLLRERVTSKGGTTYAALTSMEASGVKDAIVKAMKAAAARGKELGEEFGRD